MFFDSGSGSAFPEGRRSCISGFAMTPAGSSDWVADGEKYVLVGLSVKLEGNLSIGNITPNLSVLAGKRFDAPANWREWLGSIRAGEVEDCNLFLLSKMTSAAPDVMNAEDQKLQQSVRHFYVGLLLASPFAPAQARARPERLACGSSRISNPLFRP